MNAEQPKVKTIPFVQHCIYNLYEVSFLTVGTIKKYFRQIKPNVKHGQRAGYVCKKSFAVKYYISEY